MNALDRILLQKREELPARQARTPLTELQSRIADQAPPRGFLRALQAAPGLGLIAEVKKASPVSGTLRESFDPAEIARTYEAAGAHCLSVLTDEPHFQGSTEDLLRARAAVSLPVLRKDFTTSEYHIHEARAMGADAVLLIAYALSDIELRGFREIVEGLGMDALFEAHSLEEAERCLSAGARLLGVNNRDLTTFEMSLEVGESILPKMAGRAFLVGESSIQSREDAQRMENAGAQALLIGSAFSRSEDISSKVKEIMGWPG